MPYIMYKGEVLFVWHYALCLTAEPTILVRVLYAFGY